TWHALVVAAIVVFFTELIALTIDFIPYTRAYPPGHAKLKSLWPIYLLGIFAIAVWPTRYELAHLDDPAAVRQTLMWIGFPLGALEMVVRWRALKWTVTSDEEVPDGLSSVTVLSIGNPQRVASS